MHLFVQACILGLLTGGVYALMASGLTLAFGVMRVVNVAQGALIVLGAYLSYTLFTRCGDRPVRVDRDHDPGRCSRSASALQLAFLRPLRSDEREQLSLLVTWAIALGIEGVLSVVYQTTYRSTITELREPTRGASAATRSRRCACTRSRPRSGSSRCST